VPNDLQPGDVAADSDFDDRSDLHALVDRGGSFTFVVDWPAISRENAETIRAFWLREGAMSPSRIEGRLGEVVLHALGPDGEVAGVCTAMRFVPPHMGQPFYYWRTLIGAAWRKTPLVRMLLKRSCDLLGEYARAHDYPCIGVFLELENPRFMEAVRTAVWWNPRFMYVGRSPRGLDLRVHYFDDVELKAPQASEPQS
jgi:hypothetical protein